MLPSAIYASKNCKKSGGGSDFFRRAAALCLLTLAGCRAAPDAPDAAAPCTRIVSMAPNLTEMAFALGLGDRIVGVTRYCVHPSEARAKTDIGGFLDPNFEVILSLRPDLVLTLPSHTEARAKLEALGLRCETLGDDTFTGIFDAIARMGELCGARDAARALLDALCARADAVRVKTAGRPKPRVLIVIGRDYAAPALEQLFIAGPGRFQSQLVEEAGGVNVYTGDAAAYPVIGVEGVVQMNPDVILEMAPDLAASGVDAARARAAWKDVPGVAAVRDGRIHIFDADYVSLPGPRVMDLFEDIARALHPDLEFAP